MIVAFAEYGEEVDLLSKVVPRDACWIALEPFCIPKLEDGFSYKIAEQFFERGKIFDQVGPVSQERIGKISKIADGWIQENVAAFAGQNLQVLGYCHYYLMKLFDGVISRITILRHILERLQPEHIYVCKRRCSPPPSLEHPWAANESVWSYCLELIRDQLDYRVTVVEYGEPDEPTLSAGGSWQNRLREDFPSLYNLLRTLKTDGFVGLPRFFRTKKILSIGHGYEWRHTREIFLKHGYDLFLFDGTDKRYQDQISGDKCVDYLGKIDANHLFVFDGLNILSLVGSKLNWLMHLGIGSFLKVYRDAARLFRAVKPEAVVFSVVTSPYTWVVVQAARSLNIPIFCWGHGASGQAKHTKQKVNELLLADYYLTQGAGSQATYESYKSDFDFEPIPAGFASLDRLINLNRDTPEVPEYDVVYITTQYYQNQFYLSFWPGVFDNELFMIQKMILKYLSERNIKSIFKSAPSNYYRQPPILSTKGIVVIQGELRFTELFSKARAIVIDLPTTTVLEALTTRKPVFVLTQFIELNFRASELLKQRAICCLTADELVQRLDDFLIKGLYDADIDNDEYLKAFGTYLGDGKSAERGVQVVLDRIHVSQVER